jgi:hypothetical protein
MKISDRLNVEGPDKDGDYELTFEVDGYNESHWITRTEADALIVALTSAPPPQETEP